MSIEQIHKEIEKLDPASRAQLLVRLKAGEQFGTTSEVATPDRDDVLVLREIISILRSLGLEFVTEGQLRDAPQWSSFKKKVPGVMQYVRQVGEERLICQSVLQMGLRLLNKELRRQNIIVTGRTMMAQIHRLPACINQQLPGYAEAGVLRKLVERMTNVGTE